MNNQELTNAFEEAIAHCQAIIPASQWVTQPQGIELHTHKAKYGLVLLSGRVQVHQQFMRSETPALLKQTLYHELAHLCVGLHHAHNKRFKKVLARFSNGHEVSEAEMAQFKALVGYKWRVIAHLEGGEQKDLGGAHRKTKRYADYPKQGAGVFRVQGKKVLRFEFLPFEEN